VTDFSTPSRILEPILARSKFKQCLSLYFCPTDKLVYVETAELKYPAHLHSGRGTVAESVSVNPLQKYDGGNAPLEMEIGSFAKFYFVCCTIFSTSLDVLPDNCTCTARRVKW
jgi:hypothetical protein